MHRPLPVFIGLRFTRSKNSNKFLSFISIVSMAGLILGVAALIVVTSVLNGFEQALSEKILGMVPQSTIYSSQPVKEWQPIAEQIKINDHNVIATAPFVQARGMISIAGEVNSTILNGIEPISYRDVSILQNSMIAGNLNALSNQKDSIVLGKFVVDKYKLKLGDTVGIIISKPSDSTVGMTPSFHSFTLVGVFHVSHELDKWMSYAAMDDVSEILELNHGATAIRSKLKNVFLSAQSAKQAEAGLASFQNPAVGLTFSHGDWTQTHGGLYSAIRMQKTIMSLLLFLIILVAAFNVISTLVMSVTEKRSDVAILKTFGASSTLISRLFIVQGAIIGTIGIAMGVVLGVGLALSIHSVSAWINTTFQLGLFDNYFVEALPSRIEWLEVLMITMAAFVVVMISTLYPAFTAAKIEPVKVLGRE